MQFVLLIYETPDDLSARTNQNRDALMGPWRKYYQDLVAAGVYVTGSPLQPDTSGTTVRVKDGRRQVQDGPYADTKEQLGGFIILELPSLDAALEWAARCPAALHGAVEVRPLAPEIKRRIVEFRS